MSFSRKKLTFDAYIQSITQDEIVPRIVDQVLSGNILTSRILGKAKRWSGEVMKFPMKTAENTSLGAFDGDDLFSTEKVNTRQTLSFSPTGVYASVVLIGMDVDVNATPARVLDLLKVEMESTGQDMLDKIGDYFYTAQSGKAPLSIDDIVDDGTVAVTYGGKTRSANTYLNSSVTSSVGALALADLATAYDAARVGNKKPTLGVTTEAIFSDYEALIQPTISTNVQGALATVSRNSVTPRGALVGEVGFDALYFRGVPIVADEKCSSGDLYLLNEEYLHWYGLKSHKYQTVDLGGSTIDSPQDAPSRNHGFHWTGLKEPVNQYAEVGQLILMGQLISAAPRFHSKLEDIS